MILKQLFTHSPQSKGAYEKVGEATETALVVLVEKLNVLGVDRSGLDPRSSGVACNRRIQESWRKEFTLDFSRARKSMSVLCTSLDAPDAPASKLFVKVTFPFFFFLPLPLFSYSFFFICSFFLFFFSSFFSSSFLTFLWF